MKKTLLLALALIAVGCSEPEPRNVDELVIQGETYLYPETLEPYSGPVFELFSTTNSVYRRFNLKDGEYDGPYQTFGYDPSRRTGPLQGTMKDGKRCGEWLEQGGGTVTYDPC